MKERYGYENPFYNPEQQAKIRKNNMEKYGGASPMCSEDIKKKSRATCKEKYGVSNPCLLNPASAAPSSQELIIRSWLDEWGIAYITNDRSVIPPKELDIYIPSLKIAIECNGCYWHSDMKKTKNQMKKED